MRVVAGDVGGTKTLVALYEGDPGALVEVTSRRYESARHSGLAPILQDFLGEATATVQAACFGVAGPVIDDVCHTTNLPWRLDARALERELGIAKMHLVNDFEAVALGIGELPAAAFAVLQDRPADPRGVAAVLGAGTGLGQAILLPATEAGALPVVMPTEGGHTDFAPRDETEIALLRFLLERHSRVSYERVVSGPGLAALYQFVVAEGLAPTSDAFAARLAVAGDASAAIGEAALAEENDACVRAVELFVSVYGAEAGNLALKTLPRAGLFVAGGIAPKLIEALRSGEFMRSLRAKGRMETVLDQIPVRVVLEPRVGLLGARRAAAAMAAGTLVLDR
jgi:glucokinase